MGRTTKVRDIIGAIKDKASLSKATLLTKPTTASPQLTVLRSTTHDPFAPPHHHQIAAVLSFGDGSRATAASLMSSLMDRLNHTRSSSVALKCIILLHHIIRRGSFILQDQLSIYPAAGGRNYLNLSDFRDASTPTNWELSSWVRWYARFLEQLLSTARVLGFFLCSSSSTIDNYRDEERVTGLTNVDLLREIDALVAVFEEISKAPDPVYVQGNKVVYELMGLAAEDYLSAVNETLLGIGEFRERLSCLSFSESVEFVCILKRLENCKERLSPLFIKKKASTESLWCLVTELKERVGAVKVYGGEGRLVKQGRKERASESDRFDGRVLRLDNSVRFSSGRWGLDQIGSSILQINGESDFRV